MNISRVENTPTRRVLERKQIDVSLVWFGFVFWGGWWGLVGFEVHMPRSSSSFTLTFLTKLFNYSTTSESCTYKYYIYIYIYIYVCMYVCTSKATQLDSVQTLVKGAISIWFHLIFVVCSTLGFGFLPSHKRKFLNHILSSRPTN